MADSAFLNLVCLLGSSKPSFSLLVHFSSRSCTIYCNVEHISRANHFKQCLENKHIFVYKNIMSSVKQKEVKEW